MNGKIILGLAGAVVTVGSALAFRAHNTGAHNSVGKTLGGVHCLKCASLYFLAGGTGGAHVSKCNTKAGGGGQTLKGIGSNHYTWYTKTIGNSSCPTTGIVLHTLVTTTH
jgi:hypothetical protein